MEPVNVLLVDDRPENLLALESLLKSPDVIFHRASSGVAALELLLLHDFAVAILDVQMPEMNGFELAELMRGTAATRSVPIIFVTAGAHSSQSTFRGYESGAVDFLYKPLDPHIVKSKVLVFIEIARQRQLLRLQLRETQRVVAERDQALRTRDEFMSIASHELKTPLTSLYLQVQMMQRTMDQLNAKGQLGDNPKIRKLRDSLDVCFRQSTKLSSLLDELLDLTRIRLGKLQLSKTEVDLVSLSKDVLDRFKSVSDRAHALIELEVPDSSLIGYWDSTRLEQVLTNLISNAAKYGDGKPVKVRIWRDEINGAAMFTVKDQGIGIPEDMQEKIFQRFERAVNSGRISGLGLGLYISKQIVTAHGGSITVESALGQGSLFTLSLPLRVESCSGDVAVAE